MTESKDRYERNHRDHTPPPVLGGQGRSGVDVRDSAGALVLFLLLALAALAALVVLR